MNEGALCHNSRSRNYERHISIAVVVKGPVLKQSRARGSSAAEELSSGSGYTGECVFERRPGRVEDRAAASLVVPQLESLLAQRSKFNSWCPPHIISRWCKNSTPMKNQN